MTEGNTLVNAVVLIYLTVLSIQDIRARKISVFWLIVGGLAACGCLIWRGLQGEIVPAALLAGWMPGLVMLVFSVLGTQVGKGDGWVLCVLGSIMEYRKLLAAFAGSLLLIALWAGAVLVLHKAGKKDTLPYLPFLTVAVMCICL